MQNPGLSNQGKIDLFIAELTVCAYVMEEAAFSVGCDKDVLVFLSRRIPRISIFSVSRCRSTKSPNPSQPTLPSAPTRRPSRAKAVAVLLAHPPTARFHLINQSQLPLLRHLFNWFGQGVGYKDTQAEDIQFFCWFCHPFFPGLNHNLIVLISNG